MARLMETRPALLGLAIALHQKNADETRRYCEALHESIKFGLAPPNWSLFPEATRAYDVYKNFLQ